MHVRWPMVVNRRGSMKYLIIDDDDLFRGRLARAITDRGFSVSEADDSITARRLNAELKPQRIILDLRLRNESGLELLDHLCVFNAQIVILTGYGTISTAVEALKRGAVNYVTKPAHADTVLASFGTEQAPSVPPAPPLAQVEWEYIQRVLNECNGNITKTAKILGLHRRSLQRKLAKDPSSLL
jgi:two-component system, response regulator RegA